MKSCKPSSSEKLGPLPQRAKEDPIWFGKGDEMPDLMTVDPSEGASIFGRKLASVIFKSGSDCLLINQWMGIKMTKKGARKPTSPELENIFREVVKREFHCWNGGSNTNCPERGQPVPNGNGRRLS